MPKKWGVDPNCNCLTCKQRYSCGSYPDYWYCIYTDPKTRHAEDKDFPTQDQMWDIVHLGTACPYVEPVDEKETDNG